MDAEVGKGHGSRCDIPIEDYGKLDNAYKPETTKQKHRTQRLTMKLRMKCPKCGHWNNIDVTKLFTEQKTSEHKIQAYIPMYKPLKTETCEKCKNTIAEPNTLIRIVKT